MSEPVKRYDPEGYSQPASVSGTGTHMIECPIGDYVLASDYDALAQRCRELEADLGGISESYALRCSELETVRKVARGNIDLLDENTSLRDEVADLKARLLEAERGNEELVRLRALLRAAASWMRNGESPADALLADIDAALDVPR